MFFKKGINPCKLIETLFFSLYIDNFFKGDDFSIVQQEIYMLKECKHPNIIAYFGSYLR